MRYFFNQPQSWSDEVAGWLMVVVVMLAMPEVQRRHEHIGVDVLTEKLRGGKARLAAVWSTLSVITTASLLIAEGWETVAFTRLFGIRSPGLPDAPLWAVQALIPLGGVLLLAVALVQLVAHLRGEEAATDKDGESAMRNVE